MREDNGGEGAYEGRPYGDAEGEREGSVTATRFLGSRFAAFGDDRWGDGGWVPAFAGTTEGWGLHVGGGGHAHEGKAAVEGDAGGGGEFESGGG